MVVVDEISTLLMGTLAVDSTVREAVSRAHVMLEGGADIVSVVAADLAAASSSTANVNVFEVITALVADGFRVGIETSDANTALTAASLGASIVLDPTGGRADTFMTGVVAGAGVTFIANVLPPAGMGSSGLALADEISVRVGELLAEGISARNLAIDLGAGLAGEADRNWLPLSNIESVVALGFPVMVAASRPELLHALLPEESTEAERDAAILGVSVVAFGAGVWAVRIEDVARIRDSMKPLPIGHSGHSFNLVSTDRRSASNP